MKIKLFNQHQIELIWIELLLIIAFFSSIIFFNSCNDENSKIIDITLLSNGKWQFQKMQLTERNSKVSYYNIDTILFTAACDKDNSVVFEIDGNYLNFSGKLKCEIDEPDTAVGTWQFNKLGNKLIIQSNSASDEIYTVDELSPKLLTLDSDTTLVKSINKEKISIVVRKKFFYSKFSE